MIWTNLGRLALFCALAALVSALLWPHLARTKPTELIGRIVYNFILPKTEDNYDNEQDATSDSSQSMHPRLMGLAKSSKTTGSASPMSRVHVRSNFKPTLDSGDFPYKLIFVISSAIVGFLGINLLRVIINRLNGLDKNSSIPEDISSSTWTSWSSRNKNRRGNRSNRSEKINNLIKQHGGRNISSAIKFLSSEVKNQRYILFEKLSNGTYDIEEENVCDCCCHNQAEENQNVMDRVEQSCQDT